MAKKMRDKDGSLIKFGTFNKKTLDLIWSTLNNLDNIILIV